MSDLIMKLLKIGLQIALQQSGGKKEIAVADGLVDIVSIAMSAYKNETGLDIDPSKIKPYEPI